jgi:hypothetical protein
MTQQNDKSKPIYSIRAGHVEASVWRNEFQHDGQIKTNHSIRIQKHFRKKDGSYEKTDTYFLDEIHRLITVAQRAYEYAVMTENKDPEDEVPV